MKNRPRVATAFLLALLASAPLAAQPPIVAPSNDFVLNNRDLVIRDSAGRLRIRLDAQSGDIRVVDPEGETVVLIQQAGRNLLLGGDGRAGDLVLLPRNATNQDVDSASVHLDGSNGTQRLGGAGTHGRLVLSDAASRQRIFLGAETAELILGGEGRDGDVTVRDPQGQPTVTLDGADGQVRARRIVSSGEVRAGQIVSDHSSAGSSDGIDSASIYVESSNPAIGLRDSTGGNAQGWLIQAGSAGTLVFSAGDLGGLSRRAMVLRPDGGVCIGACS